MGAKNRSMICFTTKLHHLNDHLNVHLNDFIYENTLFRAYFDQSNVPLDLYHIVTISEQYTVKNIRHFRS